MDEDHEMGILGYLILSLAILAVLLFFFRDTITMWDQKTDAEICRKSVEVHAMAHVKGINTIENLNCPPSYEPITSGSEKEIKEELAESMAECFWKFGENELELFSGDITSQERFCALCHYVTFEDDARGVSVSNFAQYLTSNHVSSKYSKSQGYRTYADYIIGEPTDPSAIQTMGMNTFDIDTGRDYGIVFIYTKNSYIQDVVGAAIGAQTGAVIGLAGALYLLPFGVTQVGAVLLTTGIGAYTGGTLANPKSADWQEAVLLVPWNEKALSGLECTALPVPQGNK